MPLVRLQDGDCIEAESNSIFVADDSDLPHTGDVTVTLSRFLAERDKLTARGGVGVRLEPDSDPHALGEALADLAQIEVVFPKYVDGRGYSIAQLLRRRLSYTGELRAVGQVLRDQLFLMARSGFDAFEFEPTSGTAAETVQRAIGDFTQVYQPAANAAKPAFSYRVRNRVAAAAE